LKGGHIILLNPAGSSYYEATRSAALEALHAEPGDFSLGGGVTPENAWDYLNAGASHVIVTSYVFSDGRFNRHHLDQMVSAAGKKHLILDLSCRRKNDGFYIVTDRWQKWSDVKLSVDILRQLSEFCDEFLIHGVDAEGRQSGPQLELVEIIAAACAGEKQRLFPVTYAGGIGSFQDLEAVRNHGKGMVDVTIGSALDLFGGRMEYRSVLEMCGGGTR
ncbi:MAG TPA: phosphoribosylformimino-5-aminoimidazole carboxamide ribotide isomerase, partial [Lachnospiraceae bacterium]|nr:phosphoribosylformimino-5-aminoimidazole carboxamide ribotide isomerase [Lachnospiraceae bacterium]